MIDIAKKTAQAANASASDTMNKLKDINAEIDAIKALNASGSPDQANINRMLNDVDMAGEGTFLRVAFEMINVWRWIWFISFPHTVKNLSNSIPSLLDKFTEVEKLSSEIDPNNNISYNIMRIKELIEQARSAANRVRTETEERGKMTRVCHKYRPCVSNVSTSIKHNFFLLTCFM